MWTLSLWRRSGGIVIQLFQGFRCFFSPRCYCNPTLKPAAQGCLSLAGGSEVLRSASGTAMFYAWCLKLGNTQKPTEKWEHDAACVVLFGKCRRGKLATLTTPCDPHIQSDAGAEDKELKWTSQRNLPSSSWGIGSAERIRDTYGTPS